MFKRYAVLAALGILCFVASAQEIATPTSAGGFRGCVWGSSKANVTDTEGQKPDIDQKLSSGTFTGLEILGFKFRLDNLDSFVIFYFADNKLVRGRYMVTEPHTNQNAYIRDYATIKEQLIQKYGKPKEDHVTWINKLYQDEPSQYGFAVSLGHLVFNATWKTLDTEIRASLTGDNYEINLWVEYSGLAFHELEQKTIEAAKKAVW